MFEIIISDCKLYYRAIIIEQGHVHQLNTADSWKLNTATDVKTMHWRQDNLFNKWCWENWRASGLKMK